MVQNGETGGAATHKGIWYQALWCVLQAASAKLDASDAGLQLILEPVGGDAWLARPGNRRVVQLKTAYRGTWSLKEVVEEVLPDLYRSVQLGDEENVTYEFVTEGRSGRWKPVLTFFESLGTRLPHDESSEAFKAAYAALDDQSDLQFGGSGGAFWKGGRTKRRVFDRIVEYLHESEADADENASIAQARRKTGRLLAHFKFVGDVREERVRRDLDKALLAVVEHREKLASIRNSMIGDLIERSRKSHSTVSPAELLRAQGLHGIESVGRDTVLREHCYTQVRRCAELLGYRPDWDVRRSGELSSHKVPTLPSITVITGESGHGKTWRLCAEALESGFPAVVLLKSTGDVHDDLQRGADEVWGGALGHEAQVDLRGISARRADVMGTAQSVTWLVIVLDQLSGADQANALLREPIEDWGVRVFVACDAATAEVFEQYSRQRPDRVQVLHVGTFSVSERDDYLQRRLEDAWVEISQDVRQLVRSPQLAAMYCDISREPHGWQPQNEYELIEAFWRRLTGAENSAHRRDGLHFRRLAATILEDASYPWDDEQLEKADIDDEAAIRMAKAGWLRIDVDGRYEVPHERLLHFAIAKHFAVRHRNREIGDAELAELFVAMLIGSKRFSGLSLGYVPMDWFFRRTCDDGGATLAVLRGIRDRLDHEMREALHRDLLPTLGAAALPLLWDSLVAIGGTGNRWELAPILDGIAKQPVDAVRPLALELLRNSAPRLQWTALRVLSRHPMPEALDLVWQLHARMQNDPAAFLDECEPPRDTSKVSAHELYRDAFDALRECARLSPEWVAGAIKVSDPIVEPTQDLAYLAANLNDGGNIWRKCKKDLLAKVPADKRRSLAVNAHMWRDASEAEWLTQVVHVEKDLLGPAALRALAQIDPLRAITALHRLPDRELYFCRNWFLTHLLATERDATNDELRRRIRDADAPLHAGLVYSGNENQIDPRTFNLLLDALEAEVGRLLEEAKRTEPLSVRAKCNHLFSPLAMLVSMGRPDLLDELHSRRGSPLEQRLADLLVEVLGSRQALWPDNLARTPALDLLRRIGGEAHQRVVSAFLDTENQYGQLDAIQEAVASPHQNTLEKLRKITTSDASWDGHPLLQFEAMRALAAVGDALGLVEGAIHLGPMIPSDLDEWLCPQRINERAAIERAMNVVQERRVESLTGALEILGVLQHTPAIEEMIDILSDPPNDEVRLAAVISLGRLGEAASPAVQLIKDQIGQDRCRHAVCDTLFRIGTPKALQALFELLDQHWDANVAVSLSKFQHTRAAVIDRFVGRLQTGGDKAADSWQGDGDIVLSIATDDVLADIMRRCPALCDRVRETALASEGGLWFVGSKADAIRALAVLDPHTAKLAATKALTDCSSRDRHVYAALLYRLDPIKARNTFLKLAAEEPNAAVHWTLASALQPSDASWLCEQLGASSADTRLAACKLSRITTLTDKDVNEKIVRLLEDPSHHVRDAAAKVMERCQHERWTSTLVEQLDQPLIAKPRAWAILDAILAVADVGYKGTSWPRWVHQFGASRAVRECPALRMVLLKRIEKRRKKALEKAERDASRRS